MRSQWAIVQPQRALTVDFLSRRRLQAPAVWLKADTQFPKPEDAVAPSLNTVLEDWLDEGDDRNLGVRLTDGHIELSIKAADERWTGPLFEACHFLKVDARAAYGPNGGPPDAILLRIADPESIESWRGMWPRGWRAKTGHWTETAFSYSSPPIGKTIRAVWRHSKPLPGSFFNGSPIVWRPMGRPPATEIDDLEARELAATTLPTVLRAIAYATLLYWVRTYLDGLVVWDDSLTRNLGGWLARETLEGQAINARGKSLEGMCWAPIDTIDHAKALLAFLKQAGADKGIDVAYAHAETELERDPLAKVPSFRALATYLGEDARIAIRRAFRVGLDLSRVEAFAERYVYDREADAYLDREALLTDLKYSHAIDALTRRHANEVEWLGKKPKNPFTLYATSALRTDVATSNLFPGQEPGSILRYSRLHGLLKRDAEPHDDEVLVFNTYRGLAVRPPATVDPDELEAAVLMIDELLGYLTQNNPHQILWMKRNLAWTIQHPAQKQQICPVLIGGQGIGKTMWGGALMEALFGPMAGQINAKSLEKEFSVAGFIGNLVTLIDEARMESMRSINEVKRLIRSVRIPGETKNQDHKMHNIWSRLIIAANQPDIGLTPEDAADRTLYFIVGYTAENKGLSRREFQEWARTLEEFYSLFLRCLERAPFKQHLMHYFTKVIVPTWAQVHDLTYSSRDDEGVVKATMSKACEVARTIIADATIDGVSDITAWFKIADLDRRVKFKDGRYTKVTADQVLQEFDRAGVLEKERNGYYRFKFKYGTLVQAFGKATNLELEPGWDAQPHYDWGDNEVQRERDKPRWRGRDAHKANYQPFSNDDQADEEPPI